MVPRSDDWRNFYSLHTAVVCGELIIFIGRADYFYNRGNLALAIFCDFSNYLWSFGRSLAR